MNMLDLSISVQKFSYQDVFRYSAVFNYRAQESIKNNATLEIVYAPYIIAVPGIIAEKSIQRALINCLQFCRPQKAFILSGTVGSNELARIETLIMARRPTFNFLPISVCSTPQSWCSRAAGGVYLGTAQADSGRVLLSFTFRLGHRRIAIIHVYRDDMSKSHISFHIHPLSFR